MPEQKQEKQISAAAIKYLIAMGGLCGKDGKIRSVDIAEKMGVSKPSFEQLRKSAPSWEELKKIYCGK